MEMQAWNNQVLNYDDSEGSGKVIVHGAPEEVARTEDLYTGKYLAKHLYKHLRTGEDVDCKKFFDGVFLVPEYLHNH